MWDHFGVDSGIISGLGIISGVGQQLANKWSFPFSEIFRLQGSTLRGIPTFWEISYRELPYHLTSLAPVSVEGFAFGNSIISGLYRDIPRKFPFHLSSFRFFFFFFLTESVQYKKQLTYKHFFLIKSTQ